MLGTPKQGASEDGDTVVGPVSDNVELFWSLPSHAVKATGIRLSVWELNSPSAFGGIVRYRPSETGRITTPDAAR